MSDEIAASTPVVNTPAPASMWRRLAGLLYDLIAVVAIVMVVGMLSQALTLGHLVQTGAQPSIAWWYRPLQYLIVVGYFVLSWMRGGQTLGMRPWRTRLRMQDGAPINLRAALIRATIASLPLLLLALGYVTTPRIALLAPVAAWVVLLGSALFNRRRRALHDIAAGTELVQQKYSIRT
jgi:uncharacterized RDD family membrane protein YckC